MCTLGLFVALRHLPHPLPNAISPAARGRLLHHRMAEVFRSVLGRHRAICKLTRSNVVVYGDSDCFEAYPGRGTTNKLKMNFPRFASGYVDARTIFRTVRVCDLRIVLYGTGTYGAGTVRVSLPCRAGAARSTALRHSLARNALVRSVVRL